METLYFVGMKLEIVDLQDFSYLETDIRLIQYVSNISSCGTEHSP
jgi:hypothetical protein